MKTILTPVDFSTASGNVLRAAADLAQAVNGRLVLLHVIPPPVITSEYGAVMTNFTELVAIAEKSSTTQLARLQRQLQAKGVDSSTLLRTGSPSHEITAQAKKLSATYIVMGSHGHSALYDLLAGSTASGVLKKSPCPVLIVPPPKARKRG